MKSKQTKDFLEKLEPLKTDVNSGSDQDLRDDINKYYQPDISELYVGYECEINPQVITNPNLWQSATLENVEYLKRAIERPESIRTKYLDSDDIISLGFEEVPFFNENEKFSYYKRYSKSEKVIEFANTNNIEVEVITSILIGKQNITINEIRKTSFISHRDLFVGKIKSVNELKKILEWIK